MRKNYNSNSYRRKPRYTINNNITSDTVRVVDTQGEQVGILSTDEAIERARSEEKDLVLIAPQAKPPVAKIIDFKKFLYIEDKKKKEAKKGAKKSLTKDIKLSLFIADHDLERFLSKTKEFLEEGNQVRLNLTLRGREMTKRQMALEMLNTFISNLGEVNISKEPRMEGRVVRAVVSRKK